MTPLLWFANQCPYFSVHHVDLISRFEGRDVPPSARVLHYYGLIDAERWLLNNEQRWKSFLESVPMRLELYEKKQIGMIHWNESRYLTKLRNINSPPPVLFFRGNLSSCEKPSIAVVGSRNPTQLGRLWVQNEIPRLVSAGLVIASGGARGIDSEAHMSCLGHKGSTIAVLPGGLEKPYPGSNSDLFARICERGALVSEYLPRTEVRPESFHRRNRLISGLSQGVIIVEAGLKSGTIITARHALEDNIEVFVVPGPPMIRNYEGSLNLIEQGAALARSASDIEQYLVEKNILKKVKESPTLPI